MQTKLVKVVLANSGNLAVYEVSQDHPDGWTVCALGTQRFVRLPVAFEDDGTPILRWFLKGGKQPTDSFQAAALEALPLEFVYDAPVQRPPRADVVLSSGRVIAHRRLPNGAQEAVPTTGSRAMTEAEYREYCLLTGQPAAFGDLLDDGDVSARLLGELARAGQAASPGEYTGQTVRLGTA